MLTASLHFVSWALVIVTVIFIEDLSEACIFRSSWSIFPSSLNKEIVSPSPQNKNPLVLDKDTVSVVEQTLIKTLIEMGKLKFHCPKDDGMYSDMLDCRKYYRCINGSYVSHDCDAGTGFEPLAKTCVDSESVPLCQRVQRLEGFECNSTGLQTISGHCEKFVLCTGDAAFTSSCNRGDLFDQKLKLCLPEQEANCTIEVNHEEVKRENKTISK